MCIQLMGWMALGLPAIGDERPARKWLEELEQKLPSGSSGFPSCRTKKLAPPWTGRTGAAPVAAPHHLHVSAANSASSLCTSCIALHSSCAASSLATKLEV